MLRCGVEYVVAPPAQEQINHRPSDRELDVYTFIEWYSLHPRVIPEGQDAPAEHCKRISLNNVTPHPSNTMVSYIPCPVKYILQLRSENYTMQHVRIQYLLDEDVLWNNKRKKYFKGIFSSGNNIQPEVIKIYFYDSWISQTRANIFTNNT